MAQEFLATAFVKIEPKVRGFKTELLRQIKTSLGPGFSVPIKVTPDVRRLRETVTAQVGKSPIPVLLTPDTTGFRAKIIAETQSLKIKIPIEGGTAAAAAGNIEKAGRATRKLTEIQQANLDITKSLAQSRQALLSSQSAGITLDERQAAVRKASVAVERALTRQIDLSALSQSKATQTLGRKVSAAFADVKTAKQQIAASKVTTKVTNEERVAKNLLTSAEERLAIARRPVTNALTPLAAAQQTATRSSGAFLRAEKALDAALATGDKVLISKARNTLALAEAQNIEAASALRAARAQAVHATSLAQTSKGAGATGLSLLGVRGATLAANAQFLAGAAAVALFAKSVGLAAGLETELNVFAATSGATANEMERVAATARQLGADFTLPTVSAGDAAEAMTQLAKAGLDVQDSIDGARGVLQLATAAQLENSEATQLVASGLNAFGLSGAQAVRVADLLAGSANESQGSISDMGVALQQASAAARQAGFSIEDTVATLTLLARNGIRGSDAGTSLRTALIRLIRPTDIAAQRLDDLNVQIRDAEENIRPEIFADLSDALTDLSAKQRDEALAEIFGQDAFRAAAILGREGTTGLNEIRIATQQVGLAADLAGARTQGFAGKVEGLKNNLETLGSTLGGITLGPLGGFVDLLGHTATVLNFAAESGKDSFSELGNSFMEVFNPLKDGFNAINDQLIIFRKNVAEEIFGPELADPIKDAKEAVDNLFESFEETGAGSTSVNQLVLGLRDVIKELRTGDEEAQKIADQLARMVLEIQNAGTLSPAAFRDLFENMGTEVEHSAKEGAQIFRDTFSSSLTPEVGRAIGLPFFQGLASPAAGAGGEAGKVFVQNLETQLAVAEATGASDRELLRILREREDKQQAFLERMLALPQTAKRQKTVQKAAANLDSTRNQIQSILDKQEGDAKREAAENKRKAGDIARARDDADQAVIDAFGRREEDAEGRILVAQASESLGDDIKRNKQLRALLRKQNENAQQRIKDLETRRDFIRENARKILNLNNEIKDLNQQLLEQQREEQKDRQDQIRESITLDIEFAEITENRRLEIRNRQRLIASFQKELDALRKIKDKTDEEKNRIKELRNSIAREKQAIKELRDETKERNNAFRELTFEFLTTQQGFAANLLGNLLPLGAIGGTVGNVSGPSGRGGGQIGSPAAGFGGGLGEALIADIGQRSALETARTGSGPSSGQASTTNEILRQILQVLMKQEKEGRFLEARYERVRSGGAMDTL